MKSSIMLAAAACTSQLKWRHFTLLPRPLQHLQLYEDASRGPWGSIKLLFKLRTRAITAYLLAIVTLAGLAIEPSAQQVLDFPSRLGVQTNISATIGEAEVFDVETMYTNLTAKESAKRVSQDYLNTASHVLGAMGDRVSTPYFDCPTPATECFWPRLHTLGLCSTYSVVKTNILMECTWGMPDSPLFYYCEYDPAAFQNGTGSLNIMWHLQPLDGNASSGLYDLTGPVEEPSPAVVTGTWAVYQQRRLGSEFRGMIAVRLPETWQWTESNLTEAEVSMITWYWCEHTFENVTTNGRELLSGSHSSRPLNSSRFPTGGGYSGHSDVSGRDYRVSDGAARALQAPLMGFFGAPGVSGSQQVMGSLSDLDVEAATNSITAELSSQMRSQANINLTLVKGVALAPQGPASA
ncbi:hypothetical protein SLS64_006474 [Diaporthe eres]